MYARTQGGHADTVVALINDCGANAEIKAEDGTSPVVGFVDTYIHRYVHTYEYIYRYIHTYTCTFTYTYGVFRLLVYNVLVFAVKGTFIDTVLVFDSASRDHGKEERGRGSIGS